MADDVGPFDTKALEERPAISRLLLDAERPFYGIAARGTAAMVAD